MGERADQTRKFGAIEYPVTVEKVDGLTIIDHSKLFETLEDSSVKVDNKKGKINARFMYMAGSRRRVEYRVGKASLLALIVDENERGNSSSSFELVWRSRVSPLEFLKVALEHPPKGKDGQQDEHWEYVDFPRNWEYGDVRFTKLTPRVAQRVLRDSDPKLQRVNAEDMSFLAQDLNGKEGKSRPEIVVVAGLGNIAAAAMSEVIFEATVDHRLQPYFDVIKDRESEIFVA